MKRITNLKRLFVAVSFITILTTPCHADNQWQFKLTHETKQLTENPFFLITAADVNKNGVKEVIVADFGRYGDHIEEWKQWRKFLSPYKLFVLEWDQTALNVKWKKEWDLRKLPRGRDYKRYFRAYKAKQLVTWEIGDRIVVETIPPYLGLEWGKERYVLHEQQGPFSEGPLVGSWALPWLNASCYQFFQRRETWPRECLVGIRDFSGKGKPKLVTIFEERDQDYIQTIRVRNLEPAFSIEWEKNVSPKFFGDSPKVDRLNANATSGLLIHELKTNWNIFVPKKEEGIIDKLLNPIVKYLSDSKEVIKDYEIKRILTDESMGFRLYDLPDTYLRRTQKKEIEEYWGYHRVNIQDHKRMKNMFVLKKVVLKPDLTGFESESVNFQHHDEFLGVGYFNLADLDGDGLDEIVLVEETGKKKFGHEVVHYFDVKDYIRILKWNGKEYKTMWVSPPYTKRGSKFLVEDIKNTGKKQLVVMTSHGTIQIWERK